MKKIALILSLISLLVTSCTVDSIDASSERSQTLNPSEPTFMSGDLNNVPYTNLKPQTYTNATCLQSEVETFYTNATPAVPYNYLFLQGSDVTLNDTPQASSILINIRIPQSKWAVGTYTLNDDLSTGVNGVDCIASLIEIGNEKKTQLVSGSITITEFDLVNRVIKGTFSFDYMRKNGATLEGPYQLNNGAFKYKLDASYFNN